MILLFLHNTWNWIREDYTDHPLRFVVEVLAWAISIGCSFVVTITVPNVPFNYLYPLWLTGCAMYAWASWTRKSFGMLCNYGLMITLDLIGFYRVLTG